MNLETSAGRTYARTYPERRAWLDAIKLEHGCIDCGYRANPVALDFDHRDQATKAFPISSNILRSRAVLLAEIAKCDVRCANCHRVRTAGQPKTGRPRLVPLRPSQPRDPAYGSRMRTTIETAKRENPGLRTQRAVANYLGLSESAIYRWSRKARNPRIID